MCGRAGDGTRNAAAEEKIRGELEERDRRDRERTATPLVQARDAVFIDTSDLPLDEVIERALEIAGSRS
jgi:cytidylate kinase